MATKKELWEATQEVLSANKIKADVVEALRAILEPKAGGAKVDVEDAVIRNDAGEIEQLLCSLSGVLLPATAEYFYEDKAGDGFGGTGLKRLSIQAEKARKDHAKQTKASKDAIKDDLYAGNIDVATAKDLEANLVGVDYSSVGLIVDEPEAEEEVA